MGINITYRGTGAQKHMVHSGKSYKKFTDRDILFIDLILEVQCRWASGGTGVVTFKSALNHLPMLPRTGVCPVQSYPLAGRHMALHSSFVGGRRLHGGSFRFTVAQKEIFFLKILLKVAL